MRGVKKKEEEEEEVFFHCEKHLAANWKQIFGARYGGGRSRSDPVAVSMDT